MGVVETHSVSSFHQDTDLLCKRDETMPAGNHQFRNLCRAHAVVLGKLVPLVVVPGGSAEWSFRKPLPSGAV
jgi:hypothetical protein